MDTQQQISLESFWQEIDRYFGIQANTSKNDMILDLIASQCKYHGIGGTMEYIDEFCAAGFPESEYEFWAEHLTVNETYFYRNEGDWEAIRSAILPELIELHREERELRILCLGASSGEEPYTMALLLRNGFPELRNWNVTVEATDISLPQLRKARKGGPYSSRSVKNIPEVQLEKELTYDGQGWFVNEDIRKMVKFSYANLLAMPFSTKIGSYDIVFCRNVVIYFKKEVASGLVKSMFGYLRDGGYLILGHSEGSIADDAGLKPASLPGSLAYRKSSRLNGSAKRPSLAPDPSYLATSSEFGNSDSNVIVRTWVSTETHIERAKQSIEYGDLATGAKELQSLLMREPFNAEAHYFMGVIYQNMGDLGKAMAEFEKTTRMDPDFAMGYFQAAMLSQRVRNYAHAKMYYNALMNLLNKYDPESILDGSNDITAGFARMICQRFLNNHT